LEERHRAKIIKTRELILKKSPRTKPERAALQRAGQRLDGKDGGAWVGEALQRMIDTHSGGKTARGLYVIDAVRIRGQIDAIRKAYGTDVHHIHLTAPKEELERRYRERNRDGDQTLNYQALKRNRTEREIERLAEIADIVVSTDRCSEEAVLVRATALLNLYPRSNDAIVDVLIGGQFGSEGKGNIVGHIAPEYDLLVRVGGPNAGHQVYAEPKPEKYYHLPSGTQRAPNARLLLGPGAVIYPKKLLEEIAEHKVDADRLTIDHRAMIITDQDRNEEAEQFTSISSTAQGVGIASARKLTGRSDYKDGREAFLARDCEDLKPGNRFKSSSR
jgi:adenylosuccinate synthase